MPYFFQGNVVRINSLDSSIQNYTAGFILDPPVFNQTQTNTLKIYLRRFGRLYMFASGLGGSIDLLTFLGFTQITGLTAGTCVDTTLGLNGTFTEGLKIYQPISYLSQFITVTGTIAPVLRAKCPIGFDHYSAFASVSDTFKAVVDIYNYTYDGEFLKRLLKYFDLTVIPVELISFKVEISKGCVLSKWITATETNNRGFEIERKGNQQTWKTIGFVAGNGTTTKPKHYSYEDKNLPSGKYFYRLKQIDYDGSFEYSNVIEVVVGLPDKYELEQNYPNPFNPSTRIKYAISSKQFVSLKVYDILGRELATLVNEEESAGSYEVEFNAPYLSSGVYFYQLKVYNTDGGTSGFIANQKMILLR